MPGKKGVVKPTGLQGFFQVQAKDGTINAGFHQITFPPQKGEIELMVARGFSRSMDRELAKQGGEKFFLSNPRLNPETDFDITVSTPTGNASLEMREIHPGGRYHEAQSSYNPYDFAQV